MKRRIVFVNLHANPMLVKTANKFVFKQSSATKHKYLLDYLLADNEFEICSYINPRGFSMASKVPNLILKILNLFRFMEHRIILKKNGIPTNAIRVLRNINQISPDDLVILYRHCESQLYDADKIKAYKAISMIHFWGKQSESARMKQIEPNDLFCEADLGKYSEIFQKYYGWFQKDFVVHPFVFEPRFKRIKPFAERENKAFATGTITYKKDPDFLSVYGDPCDQPARKQIKDNAEALKDLIYCTSSDYSEDAKTVVSKKNNSAMKRLYKTLHYKLFESQQKKYYSFDMVQSFNNYKMCIVGEEVLGVPGIGFVEGMACGCAYIGQDKGYYEDLGMKAGVHYIAYNGTLEDLKEKISYYQQPDNQEKLEQIANAGYEFAQEHFSGRNVAYNLINTLLEKQQAYLGNHK